MSTRLAAVHGQAALLVQYDVPIYHVSRELLAAAARTELPDDMVFDAIPFRFDALVLMLPKGTVRLPTDEDCPFLGCHEPPKDRTFPDDRGPDAGVTAEPSSWSSGVDKFHSSTLIVGL